MRSKHGQAFAGILVLAILAIPACSPQAAPTLTPDRQTPQATSAVRSAPASPTLSAQDAALAKLVSAAKEEGKLTVYSYTWVGDSGLAIAKAFQDKYGIQVDIVTGRGAEFIERMKTERRVHQITGDFTEGSPLHLLNMKKEGLTRTLAGLEVLNHPDDFVVALDRLDPEKNVLVFRLSYYTPWVNTKLVKPSDEPRRWADLLDPKWKGKMTIGDPQIAGSLYQAFSPLISAGIINLDFVRDLGKQNPTIFTGEVDSGQALARGDYAMIPAGTNTSLARFVQDGAPIKPVFLEDGTTGIGGSVAAIKDSPHSNAANLFASWLFSPEGQETVSKAQQLPVVRKGVHDYSPAGTELKAKKMVLQTQEDNDNANQMFRDGVIAKLWGRATK